ncbi:MAG TPA: serine hydrolase domain-containing protein [Pyrinomonadaceae bacterium]|jgi:CubicO group peptidase (beta-lactamase class C family)
MKNPINNSNAVKTSVFINRWCLLGLIFFAFLGGVNAQIKKYSPAKLEFEEKIPSWLRENNVPALGIGIIENGKLKQVKVFGELKKGVPAPPDAIFQVASLTKPVVGMLTLKLVSQGKWHLDEPLYQYWIDPEVANDPRHKKLTTRHVLTHQTGFANWRSMSESKKLEFNFEPGTKTNYSGEGLEYLRRALEIKFKKSLDELSREFLFEPYAMKDTRYFWDEKMDESRFAVAHNAQGKAYDIFKNKNANAADLLLTTVEDYGKFAVEAMKGAGLSRKIFDDMIRPQAAFSGGKDLSFGLGWMIMKDLAGGEYALIHTGSDPGVQTLVVLLPKSKRGLIVFTNGDKGIEVWKNVLAETLDLGKEMLERGK